MIFTTPFIPFQAELIKLFSSADEVTFEVYDSGLSIDEILADLKALANVHYGVIADVACTPSCGESMCGWNFSPPTRAASRWPI